MPKINQPSSATRSMGFKLLVICALAAFMAIPSLFVGSLLDDRTQRAAEVTNDISSHVGGPQTLLGPTLAIPYVTPQSVLQPLNHGIYLVFPAQANANLQTITTERHRSLFRVPVFRADLKLDSTFNLKGVPSAPPPDALLDWSRAEIVVGLSDPRGALSDVTLAAGGRNLIFKPSALTNEISFGSKDHKLGLVLLGTNISGLAHPEASFHATATLKFSGAQRIAVLSYGQSTHLTARGDWRSPGFDGAILPISQNVSGQGFGAEWSVPFVARGVRAEGPLDFLSELSGTELGISFIEVADAYQSVNRSLKYVLLILGLVFLSYFVFEVSSGKRVHPAQYVLVGVAQLVFYLLLLSIAERVGFDLGYLLAAAATVALLSANAGWIFTSRLQAMKALLTFASLYGLIYLLLRLEDNALMVGAITSFSAVAAVMYLTRGLDWYNLPATRTAEALPSLEAI